MITSAALWAKLKRDTAGQVIGWHSLVDHSADVAAVVERLLIQPTIRKRLATAADRSDLDEVTRARLGALSFLHDIGKANRGFRARVDTQAPPVGTGRRERACSAAAGRSDAEANAKLNGGGSSARAGMDLDTGCTILANIFANELGGTMQNAVAQRHCEECVLVPETLTKRHVIGLVGMEQSRFQDRCLKPLGHPSVATISMALAHIPDRTFFEHRAVCYHFCSSEAQR
jgi:hypothetical protein